MREKKNKKDCRTNRIWGNGGMGGELYPASKKRFRGKNILLKGHVWCTEKSEPGSWEIKVNGTGRKKKGNSGTGKEKREVEKEREEGVGEVSRQHNESQLT